MVKIRLARGGAKKNPVYHVVVIDSRKQRDGLCIERVGFFDPAAATAEASGKSLKINTERVNYWLGQGAQPSKRVSKLIKQYSRVA